MATHSSILAWRIPWTEELAGCSPWSHQESDTTEQHFHFFFSIWTSDLRKTNLALRFTSMLRSMRIFYYLRLLNGFKINKGHTVNDGIVYEPCHLARNFSWCQDLSPSTWHQVFQQISQKYQYCFFSRNLEKAQFSFATILKKYCDYKNNFLSNLVFESHETFISPWNCSLCS